MSGFKTKIGGVAVDLDNLFIRGTISGDTNFKIGTTDLSARYAAYTGTKGHTVATNYLIGSDEKDLNETFEPLQPFTTNGTVTTSTNKYTITFTSPTGTITFKPGFEYTVNMTLVGGGGGGSGGVGPDGSGTGTDNYGSGGGSGGVIAATNCDIVKGSQYEVVVGPVGEGGIYANSGKNGGDSTFKLDKDNYLKALGGGGGYFDSNYQAKGGTRGATDPKIVCATLKQSTTGDGGNGWINFSDTEGTSGMDTKFGNEKSPYGGGGGGGQSNGTGGRAGLNGIGGQFGGPAGEHNGQTALLTSYGSGGGGGGSVPASGGGIGGNGAPGVVIIEVVMTPFVSAAPAVEAPALEPVIDPEPAPAPAPAPVSIKMNAKSSIATLEPVRYDDEYISTTSQITWYANGNEIMYLFNDSNDVEFKNISAIKSTQVCIVGGGGYGGHGGNVPVTNAFVGGGNGGNSGSTRVVNITPEIGKKYNVFVPGTGGSYKYAFKGMLKENPQTLFDIYTMSCGTGVSGGNGGISPSNGAPNTNVFSTKCFNISFGGSGGGGSNDKIGNCGSIDDNGNSIGGQSNYLTQLSGKNATDISAGGGGGSFKGYGGDGGPGAVIIVIEI
jgi:hypothetical protein